MSLNLKPCQHRSARQATHHPAPSFRVVRRRRHQNSACPILPIPQKQARRRGKHSTTHSIAQSSPSTALHSSAPSLASSRSLPAPRRSLSPGLSFVCRPVLPPITTLVTCCGRIQENRSRAPLLALRPPSLTRPPPLPFPQVNERRGRPSRQTALTERTHPILHSPSPLHRTTHQHPPRPLPSLRQHGLWRPWLRAFPGGTVC